MALPPILSNLPIFKLFKTAAPSSSARQAGQSTKSAVPKDVVEISEAAKKRMEGLRPLSLKNESELRETLGKTRDLIAEHGVSLGLDPSFG